MGLAWVPIRERLKTAKKQKGGVVVEGGGIELSGHPARPWLKHLFSLSLVSRGFKQK